MCGRFTCTNLTQKTVKDKFNVDKISFDIKPRYNIAPSQVIPTILNISPEELRLTKWGLVPHWAKDEKIGHKMINARSESITEKPSFRKPIHSQRCLIIADSFYEWKKLGVLKKPYRIMLKNEELFAFAGIWDTWQHEGKTLTTSSIITTSANSLMESIHDRMPVIIEEGKEKNWLMEKDIDKVLSYLKPYDADKMKAYEISTLINSPAHDQEDVLKKIE